MSTFETSLFKIEENKDLIDSLHLTPFSFLYKQTKNIFITYGNEDLDEINDKCSTVTNISLLSPKPRSHINIYSKKAINSNRNCDTYKNEYYINFKNDYISKTQATFYDLSNKLNLMSSKDHQNSRQNVLSLSGSLENKMQKNIKNSKNDFISKSFKKLLYPKFEKVKTCDVIFIASKRRKNSKDEALSINHSNYKYNHEHTCHKFPMSPQLKNVYNVISKNMKTKDIDSPTIELYNNKMNQINKRRNKNNKMDPNTMIEKEKKTDKK